MMHRSKILIFLGIVLVLCSAGLFSHNMYVDYESRIKEEKIADDLIKKMGDNLNDDSAIDVDGTKYIGLLEIPKINVTLAVSRDYSFEQMSESLCRYSGSIEDKNIIICGHNYKSFLENLKDVFDNDVLYFIDVSGKRTKYTVVETQYIDGNDSNKLYTDEENWDLTVFTCNYSGYMRYLVRCKMAENKLKPSRLREG